jgi:hypothetical protein
MRYILIISFMIFFSAGRVFSQSNNQSDKPAAAAGDFLSQIRSDRTTGGRVTIVMDPGVEDNYYKDLMYNQKNSGIKGYRIRIFTGSGNAFEDAKKARSRFLSLYDNIGAYIEYDAPDYKVYVGDCRTKSEVLKLLEKIKPEFGNAFSVTHDIRIDNK